jgi:hypothetical protein
MVVAGGLILHGPVKLRQAHPEPTAARLGLADFETIQVESGR